MKWKNNEIESMWMVNIEESLEDLPMDVERHVPPESHVLDMVSTEYADDLARRDAERSEYLNRILKIKPRK